VLEDVRNTGVVFGEGPKIAAENLVFVVGSVNGQHFSASCAMAKEFCTQTALGNLRKNAAG